MSERTTPGLRPRVIFVDHVARLSGGEIALLRLLPALRAYADIHVLLGEEGPLLERVRALGIGAEVVPLPPRLRDVRKETVRIGALDPFALAPLVPYVWRLSRRIRVLQADLVHTNSLKAGLYGGVAAQLAGVPAVWHLRDRVAGDYLPRGAVALLRGTSQILPATVVANSQATLDTLPARLRQRARLRPVVVPDSVERPPFRTSSRHCGMTVGVVGRLAPWKGQHIFLDAFAAAFAGTEVRGRLVGSALFGEDDYARALEHQAVRLGIAEQIEFRGFCEDIWAELAELDVVVHCSITAEPFGQVVLEAMAAGVPVIAAGAGGPAELITNGVHGLLTVPGDIPELASALRRLVADPELRQRLARAGRDRSAEFSPQQAAEKLQRLYGELLRRS